VPSQVVDHKEPHHGQHDLFWNPANHQALCKPCHDRKTVRENEGFGRKANGFKSLQLLAEGPPQGSAVRMSTMGGVRNGR
jgi:5-methylcytosine-specific restriction protein A